MEEIGLVPGAGVGSGEGAGSGAGDGPGAGAGPGAGTGPGSGPGKGSGAGPGGSGCGRGGTGGAGSCPLVEGKVELTHALETVLGRYSQCLAEGIFRFGRELDPQTAGEDEFVLVLPVNRIGRQAAGEAVVESGTQGIHVCVWSLPAMAGILLPGA